MRRKVNLCLCFYERLMYGLSLKVLKKQKRSSLSFSLVSSPIVFVHCIIFQIIVFTSLRGEL